MRHQQNKKKQPGRKVAPLVTLKEEECESN